jgi:hypothetical protein
MSSTESFIPSQWTHSIPLAPIIGSAGNLPIQQTLTEYLLHIRHCCRNWRWNPQKNAKGLALLELQQGREKPYEIYTYLFLHICVHV